MSDLTDLFLFLFILLMFLLCFSYVYAIFYILHIHCHSWQGALQEYELSAGMYGSITHFN